MLLSSHEVVADILTQREAVGELHHAIEQSLLTRDDVHAELGEVIAGTSAEAPRKSKLRSSIPPDPQRRMWRAAVI